MLFSVSLYSTLSIFEDFWHPSFRFLSFCFSLLINTVRHYYGNFVCDCVCHSVYVSTTSMRCVQLVKHIFKHFHHQSRDKSRRNSEGSLSYGTLSISAYHAYAHNILHTIFCVKREERQLENSQLFESCMYVAPGVNIVFLSLEQLIINFNVKFNTNTASVLPKCFFYTNRHSRLYITVTFHNFTIAKDKSDAYYSCHQVYKILQMCLEYKFSQAFRYISYFQLTKWDQLIKASILEYYCLSDAICQVNDHTIFWLCMRCVTTRVTASELTTNFNYLFIYLLSFVY